MLPSPRRVLLPASSPLLSRCPGSTGKHAEWPTCLAKTRGRTIQSQRSRRSQQWRYRLSSWLLEKSQSMIFPQRELKEKQLHTRRRRYEPSRRGKTTQISEHSRSCKHSLYTETIWGYVTLNSFQTEWVILSIKRTISTVAFTSWHGKVAGTIGSRHRGIQEWSIWLQETIS